jgi:putative FmdB family regulatory protein
MPLYEYLCDACAHRFEIIQKFSDAPPDACPSCGKGPVVRQMSSPAIQFKGTGWYVTDYGQKGKSESRSSGKSDSAKGDAGSADKGAAAGNAASTSDAAAKADAPAKSPAASGGDKS